MPVVTRQGKGAKNSDVTRDREWEEREGRDTGRLHAEGDGATPRERSEGGRGESSRETGTNVLCEGGALQEILCSTNKQVRARDQLRNSNNTEQNRTA